MGRNIGLIIVITIVLRLIGFIVLKIRAKKN